MNIEFGCGDTPLRKDYKTSDIRDIPTLFEDNTTRHVNNDIVKIIIDNFVEKFFK